MSSNHSPEIKVNEASHIPTLPAYHDVVNLKGSTIHRAIPDDAHSTPTESVRWALRNVFQWTDSANREKQGTTWRRDAGDQSIDVGYSYETHAVGPQYSLRCACEPTERSPRSRTCVGDLKLMQVQRAKDLEKLLDRLMKHRMAHGCGCSLRQVLLERPTKRLRWAVIREIAGPSPLPPPHHPDGVVSWTLEPSSTTPCGRVGGVFECLTDEIRAWMMVVTVVAHAADCKCLATGELPRLVTLWNSEARREPPTLLRLLRGASDVHVLGRSELEHGSQGKDPATRAAAYPPPFVRTQKAYEQ